MDAAAGESEVTMVRRQGPQLGVPVEFSHYYDRPSRDEVESRADEGLDTITLVRRENPDPTKPAVVVGISRITFEAPIDQNRDGDYYADWQSPLTKATSFYVVKRSLRGRRFLVKLNDLKAIEG